jgi:glycosyltransferase involved in cell wall biosynthesis
MKLSIIIPVWNEEKTLKKLLSKIEEADLRDFKREIILVDDGSTDSTKEILKHYKDKKNYKVLLNEKNSGKTFSVKKGILKSTGDIVVIQDADLEYDPNDFRKMLNRIIDDNVEIVYGNRFGSLLGEKGPNYSGNLFLTFVSNLFTMWRGFKVPDMETCYKMIRGDIARDIAKNITTKSRFGLEPEITAKLAKYKRKGQHLKLMVVDIHYFPRDKKEGKKMNAIKNGLEAVWEIVRYNVFD